MAKLAILGHKTRGKEVIEILEMLGGITYYNLSGTQVLCAYYITDDKRVEWTDYPAFKDSLIFSIEAFEKKYPHKVGDKVCFPDDLSTPFTINKMWWDENANELLCSFIEDDIEVPVVGIRAYKEKSIDKTNKVVFDTNAQSCDIMNDIIKEDMKTITIDDFKANTKEWLIDKLESMSKDNALQTINNIYDELHKPKYPKTYEECCDILDIYPIYNKPNLCICEWHPETREMHEHYSKLANLSHKDIAFMILLFCRDVYWKIAGDWKPDVMYCDLYCIGYDGNVITWKMQGGCRLLAFPTEEIRDAFYENFKEEIETCKEFL